MFVIGTLAILGALLVDRAFGVDVTILGRLKSPDEQAEWRQLRDPKDDVAEIYGVVEPPRGRNRVLVAEGDPRLIIPEEDPERRLLFVDRADGDSVVFADQVRFVARVVAALLLFAALGVLIIDRARTRRAASRTASSS